MVLVSNPGAAGGVLAVPGVRTARRHADDYWEMMKGRERGFTLIELMIVVAILGVLAAIAIALFSSLQARARTSRAQADVRTLASAVMSYSAHTMAIPSSAANMSAGLTTATTVDGVAAGPFLTTIPSPPPGGSAVWSPYAYSPNVAPGGSLAIGAFVVCASGDGTFANSGGVASCP